MVYYTHSKRGRVLLTVNIIKYIKHKEDLTMKLQLDKKNQVEAKKDVQETAKEVGNAAVDAKAPVRS